MIGLGSWTKMAPDGASCERAKRRLQLGHRRDFTRGHTAIRQDRQSHLLSLGTSIVLLSAYELAGLLPSYPAHHLPPGITLQHY